MWNKEETKESCPDPFKNKVKCEVCRCWIDLSDAKSVEVFTDEWCGGFSPSYTQNYCHAHAKPYRRIHYYFKQDKKAQYFGEVEMTEDGKPIAHHPHR